MKTYIPYSLLLAVAASGLAMGADTAYTTPVGYVSVAVPAASDTTIAPSLSKASLFQGVSTGVAGNVVTVAATGAAVDAFINAGDTNAKSYLLVRSGALAGLRFPVSQNSATTITVVGGATTLAAQGFVSGDQVSVVPYWTLATLFPQGAGVGKSNDIFNPSAFVLFSDQAGTGANRGSAALYFYNDGTDGNAVGWYDADNVFDGLKDTVAIDPSVTLTVRASAASTVTVAGEVPSTSLSTTILTAASTNDEYLAVPFPIDTALGQSGLQSVIKPATDVFNPTEFVFVYNDEAAGVNKGAAASYFYFAGDSEFTAGWYDADAVFDGVVTAKVLKAGRAFTLRKAGGTPATAKWTAPLPYTL